MIRVMRRQELTKSSESVFFVAEYLESHFLSGMRFQEIYLPSRHTLDPSANVQADIFLIVLWF